MAEVELKSGILAILEEDREFRLSVAGLVGLKEVLDKLNEHDRKFNEILERMYEHDRKFEEIVSILKDHSQRFDEHTRLFTALDLKLEIEHPQE